MYRRDHCYVLSIEEFFLPFARKLSDDNRWITMTELISWDESDDDYAEQSCRGFGAPPTTYRIAFGASIINSLLVPTHEELFEEAKECLYPYFFIRLEAFQGRFRPLSSNFGS
jgi:hypothetical protein